MTFKKTIGKIHLWLGLISGLVVFIVSITGCIYAFQHELQDLTQPYRFVKDVKGISLPPSEIKHIGEKAYHNKKANRLYMLSSERSAMVMFYGENYYQVVFIDQYTGEILKNKDMQSDFFTIVLAIHMRLLLPGKAGELVVPICTLLFVIMLISGIVLWWPKNKAALKQRFSIKWRAQWRRKNYDFHNVFGFYASWAALLIALTGLIWGFKWFQDVVYWTASGGKPTPGYPVVNSDTLSQQMTLKPLDMLFNQLQDEYSHDIALIAMLPATETGGYAIMINEHIDSFWKSEYRFFDQYTLKEYPSNGRYGKYTEATAADKILKLNYDIHTGGIFGFFGKCLAFLASLIAASLPVTGFIIWWGRKKKHTEEKKTDITAARISKKKKIKPKIKKRSIVIGEA